MVQHPGGVGGGARDNAAAISLSHVLSGLQEEGALADVLQEQPGLAHGEFCQKYLYTYSGTSKCREKASTTPSLGLSLGDVSSDPETLRFQYQPGVEGVLQHLPMPPAAPTAKRKEKAVYREQVRVPTLLVPGVALSSSVSLSV